MPRIGETPPISVSNHVDKKYNPSNLDRRGDTTDYKRNGKGGGRRRERFSNDGGEFRRRETDRSRGRGEGEQCRLSTYLRRLGPFY